MTTLRHFGFSEACALPRCSVVPSQHRESPVLRVPDVRTTPRRPGRVRWLLAGALRALGRVLLGLWAIAALGFCTAIAMSLM
jgi:hypothetical protein